MITAEDAHAWRSLEVYCQQYAADHPHLHGRQLIDQLVDDLLATAAILEVPARLRFIKAADRALEWRRDQIMIARLAWCYLCGLLGQNVDWHALFECDRHGHHPLSGPNTRWVGPYTFEDTGPYTDSGGCSGF